MAKAITHPTYDTEFPEEFNWILLENENVCEIATIISDIIKKEIIDTPGLRTALNVIAANENTI